MNKEDIHFPDIKRLLLGNAPLEFMLEVAVRTVIIYVILLVIIRFLGKRMGAQLTMTEMAIMVTLGGIVSLPMQDPQRGILQGIVILICVLLFQFLLGKIAFHKRKVEVAVHGDVSLLVHNGKIDLDQLKKARISHEQLFANLRAKKITQLGQVERVYFEGCGVFSAFTKDNPKPGLSIIPQKDKEVFDQQQRVDNVYACMDCGNVVEAKPKPSENCKRCNGKEWLPAVSGEIQ